MRKYVTHTETRPLTDEGIEESDLRELREFQDGLQAGQYLVLLKHATVPTIFPAAGPVSLTFEHAQDRAIPFLNDPKTFSRVWIASSFETVELVKVAVTS